MGWRVFSRRMVPVGNRVVIVLGAGYRGVGVSGIGVSRYRGDSRCWGIGVLGYWDIGILGPEWVHGGFRWERGSLVRSRVTEFIPALIHAG